VVNKSQVQVAILSRLKKMADTAPVIAQYSEAALRKELEAVKAENAGLRESLSAYLRRVEKLEAALRALNVDPEVVCG
jgi:hypothetical protein